jgi:hypothetical protein
MPNCNYPLTRDLVDIASCPDDYVRPLCSTVLLIRSHSTILAIADVRDRMMVLCYKSRLGKSEGYPLSLTSCHACTMVHPHSAHTCVGGSGL